MKKLLGLLAFAVMALGCSQRGNDGVGSGGLRADAGSSPTSCNCSGTQICCDVGGTLACLFPNGDPNNCGACGNVCNSGVCRSGVCVGEDGAVPRRDAGPSTGGECSPTCSSSERCCGGDCVNREATRGDDGRADPSFNNCNGCGLACDPELASACSRPSTGGAPASCMCGSQPQCAADESCVAAGSSFRCTDPSTDPDNCGEPGRVCAAGETCSGGMCVCSARAGACGAGEACCDGECTSGDDDNNCGGCGIVCPGGTSCSGGECLCGGVECDGPSGASLGEVCCGGACIPHSATNCGECGAACTDGMMCIYGVDPLSTTGASEVCCGLSLAGTGICFDLGLGGLGGLPI